MGTIFQRSERGGAGGKWYAEYTDHTGRRVRKSTGTRDRKTAEKILHQWEIDVAKRQSGLIDPLAEHAKLHRDKPINEHFDRFIASMEAQNRSAQYCSENRSRWNRIVAAEGWETLADVTAESLERFILSIAKREGDQLGRSQRTVSQYLQTAKGFTKWCVKTGRLQSDSLASIRKPNPEADRRLERRMLLPAEWPWLIKSIDQPSYGIAPVERQLLYEVAIQTGLRLSELQSLIVANCRFESRQVVISATDTKNKIVARQSITEDLASRWASFLNNQHRYGRDLAFASFSKFVAAKMVRYDITRAREMWLSKSSNKDELVKRSKSDFLAVTNHSGESLDFHSLRHTCGAWLAIQNVHPKTIQSIMRHSTITLTLDTYGHLMPGAESGAIDRLSKLFGQSNGQ